MSADTRFRINAPQVTHEAIDGETLIVNLDNGNYYSLLGVGARIWSLMERGAAVGDIVDMIDHHYEGARVDIEKAIDKFLAELQEEELIARDGGSPPASIAEVGTRTETEAGDRRPAFEPPILNKYTDAQDLLLLDPIHEVDETGWPTPKLSADE